MGSRLRVAGAVAVLLVACVSLPAGAQNDAGRHLRMPFPQDDGSLTPYTFELGYPLMTLVYDTLMWRDRDGIPQPWLARSVDPSADGLRVTIRLVDGVTWQDGAPLTADDVAFTFTYMAAHEHPRFTPELNAIATTVADDPSTVTVTLTHPVAGFLDQPLADVPILPAHIWRSLPEHEVAPRGLPVGTGPYRLVVHDSTAYRFEANRSYFRGAPAVDVIEVAISNDVENMYLRLQTGLTDVVPLSLPKGVPERLGQPGLSLVSGPSYVGTAVQFNLRTPPFDNAELRRALSQAIDVRDVAASVGVATPADHGFLHPESRWAPGRALGAFDEASARATIARVHPPPVVLLSPDNDPPRIEAAHQVGLAWARVGVTVEVKRMSRQELLNALGSNGSEPQFMAAVTATPALASYDPDFLRRQFGSPATGGSLNTTGYSSHEFDDLATRVEAELDSGTRRDLVTQELEVLDKDAPAVPLLFSNGVFGYRPGVFDGWVFVKGTGILDKRSFVDTLPLPPGARAPGGPTVVDQGRDGSLWAIIGGALAAVGVGGALVVLRRRGRRATI